MIYLVSKQKKLFVSDKYTKISVEESLKLLWKLDIIGVDTETEGFDPYTNRLLILQLGNKDIQIVIDCLTIDPLLYKELLESKNKVFLFWNAKFDLKFLYHLRIVVSSVWDGYLAEKILWLGYPPGMRRLSLQKAGENYLGISLDKAIRDIIGNSGLIDEVIVYAAEDVAHLEDIREKQLILLEEKDLLISLSVENEFVKVLSYIEYCGIKLDPEKWSQKMEIDLLRLKTAEDKLNNWVIKNFPTHTKFCKQDLQGDLFEGFNKQLYCNINWNSSVQVIPLFELLGFDLNVIDKKTGFPKRSIEASIIEPQLFKSDIAAIYLEFKEAQKVVSTYGESVLKQLNPITNRIHTNFSQLMDTGRLSCGGQNKKTGEDYVNLQNLPNNNSTRHSFIASPGYSLIDCDYTGQEDYVFTELSQEPKLVAFYNDSVPRDGHSFTAKICFPGELQDIEELEVKKVRKDLRDKAKTAKFALHYGGNGKTVARNLGLILEEGMRIEKSYFSGFTGIDAYFKKVKKEAWERGYILLSPIIRNKSFIHDWEKLKELEKKYSEPGFWEKYRRFKALSNKHPLLDEVKEYFKRKSACDRKAMNYPIQGTSALITKIAGVKFFNYLIQNNLLFLVLIVNDVHDEYIVEAPDTIVNVVANNLQKSMEEAADIFCKSVKLKAEPEIAKYWKH